MSKSMTAYMILAKTQPLTINHQLPIYWSHKVAVNELKKYGGTLVKVKLEWDIKTKEV